MLLKSLTLQTEFLQNPNKEHDAIGVQFSGEQEEICREIFSLYNYEKNKEDNANKRTPNLTHFDSKEKGLTKRYCRLKIPEFSRSRERERMEHNNFQG